MNTQPRFQLRISPEKELKLLTRIAAGLAASGHFTYPPETFPEEIPADALDVLRTYAIETPGPDGTTRITGAVLLTDTAREILSGCVGTSKSTSRIAQSCTAIWPRNKCRPNELGWIKPGWR
jgi:hypothetical protein